MAGFEPAVSCSRNTRNTRLSYILPASPRRIMFVVKITVEDDSLETLKSAQRELNPHFRHGKATGCRYIIGALWCAELSKIKSTGWESNPRCRLTSAGSWPLDDQCQPCCTWCPFQWDQRDLNPHPAD